MTAHDQNTPSPGSFWTSRAFFVCVVFLVIGGILLWSEHLAHALGYLPYLPPPSNPQGGPPASRC